MPKIKYMTTKNTKSARSDLELELANVMGITKVTVSDSTTLKTIIIVGERHQCVDQNEYHMGKFVEEYKDSCDQYLDVLVEANFMDRFMIGKGCGKQDIDQDTMDTMDCLYKQMFENNECDKVRFHAIDFRTDGVVYLLTHLQDQFKDIDKFSDAHKQSLYTVLRHAVGIYVNWVQMAQKINHKQLRNIKDDIRFEEFFLQADSNIHTVIEELETYLKETNDNLKWKLCLKNMTYLIDMGTNVYAFLRAGRDDLQSTNRIIYVGEYHRHQINQILNQLNENKFDTKMSDEVDNLTFTRSYLVECLQTNPKSTSTVSLVSTVSKGFKF